MDNTYVSRIIIIYIYIYYLCGRFVILFDDMYMYTYIYLYLCLLHAQAQRLLSGRICIAGAALGHIRLVTDAVVYIYIARSNSYSHDI